MQKKETAGKKKNDAVILSDTRAFVIQANDLKVYKAKQETYQILNKKDSFPGCSYSKEDISADLCFVDQCHKLYGSKAQLGRCFYAP